MGNCGYIFRYNSSPHFAPVCFFPRFHLGFLIFRSYLGLIWFKKMKKRTSKLSKLEKNRESILTDDLSLCYLCGKPKQHIHEVYHGVNRQNSMKWGCCIPVCLQCHQRIHSIAELDRQLKIKMQHKFEEVYDDDFLSIFKRNYL